MRIFVHRPGLVYFELSAGAKGALGLYFFVQMLARRRSTSGGA